MGQSFCGIRKLLWLTIVQAFFRHLWGGRNGRIFRDVSSFDWSMDMVLFTAFLWCKNKHHFALYNLFNFQLEIFVVIHGVWSIRLLSQKKVLGGKLLETRLKRKGIWNGMQDILVFRTN